MFNKSAEYYDLIYAQFKDYKRETEHIHQLIAQYAPHAGDILDIGCGTGEHAARLARQYNYAVDGVDIEPAFIKLAQKKHTGGTVTVADIAPTYPDELIRAFDLDPVFSSAFTALTPGRQRGYLVHFSSAKQSKTRSSRIEKAVSKIFAGKG